MSEAKRIFDWQHIHAVLNRRLAETGASFEHDPVRAQAILRQRSIQLAAPTPERTRASASVDFLIFRAAGARYALPLASLREIVPMPPAAPVPGAAATVCGVIAWRGEFVTVFDLAAALGFDGRDAPSTAAIVLRKEAPRVALTIEGAERMTRLDPAQLRPPDAWQSGRAGLLRGTTTDGVAILDEMRLTARLSQELRAA